MGDASFRLKFALIVKTPAELTKVICDEFVIRAEVFVERVAWLCSVHWKEVSAYDFKKFLVRA